MYPRVIPCSVACSLSCALEGLPDGCRVLPYRWVMNMQVCGGNAGYLLRASRHFKMLKGWTKGGLCLPSDHGLRFIEPSCHVHAL